MNLGRFFLAAAATFALLSAPLTAQWLGYKAPGIPRTPDGKPNLAAPTPKTSDGKPDLNGIWRGPRGSVYMQNIAADLKAGDIQPWAEARYQQRILNLGADSPRAHCLPDAPPDYHVRGLTRIVQSPQAIVLLVEGISNNGVSRIIHTDGRGLPEDPNPTWLGYSVGHWEGDRLIATTAGFNDKGWLDGSGHPRTEALKITERFRRRDFGHMEFDMTVDDPKTFTKPFTMKMDKTLEPDTDILESVCEENDRIATHLKGDTGTRLSPEVLSSFAGTYEVAPGRLATVTVSGDLLLLQRGANAPQEPFAPQSQTVFVSRQNGEQLNAGDRLEFIKDAGGAVTQLVLHTRAGDMRASRKPGAR